MRVQPPTDIRSHLETLYSVFANYERKDHIESCPCCRGPESIRPLYERPLRHLGPEDLYSYAFCAMTTIGDVNDFRHFLPRMFELLTDPDFLSNVDQEVVLSKLQYGKWYTWPVEEQAAVREYLRSLWDLVLRTPLDDDPYVEARAGRWLCALARAENDLSLYLDQWIANDSLAAKSHLERFVTDHRNELAVPLVPSGYWEDAPTQWHQVVHWLTASGLSPSTR